MEKEKHKVVMLIILGFCLVKVKILHLKLSILSWYLLEYLTAC